MDNLKFGLWIGNVEGDYFRKYLRIFDLYVEPFPLVLGGCKPVLNGSQVRSMRSSSYDGMIE